MLGVTGNCYLTLQKVGTCIIIKYIAKSEVKQQLIKVVSYLWQIAVLTVHFLSLQSNNS